MTTYVALLRGINVGGRTRVGMDDLRRLFLGLGHADAKSYLQSGNVIFRGPVEESSRLAGGIERRITRDLGVTVTVLLRTKDDLAHVVANNPFLSRETDFTKLHVTFLADAPDHQRVARLDTPSGEPDELSLVGREVYLHCPNGYGRTKLNNAYIERRLGVAATTRNWKTVTTLCALASD
ncbi:MAG: DUF1697 domain-containing protein [Chloroflexi bacterium]|nr:DUF1697 domain-containing protein [Chloroflexota bacterium]